MLFDQKLWKQALLKTLPILAGYLVLGIGFGVILTAKGIHPLWAGIMSIFIYGGTMQYVAVELFAAEAPMLTIILTAMLVNARHLFYGLSMIEKYQGAGLVKPFLIFFLSDETYSLVASDHSPMGEKERIRYYFLLSFLDYFYWFFGACLGALLGSLLDFNSQGMDFVLTALFVSILVDQWEENPHHFAVLCGLGLTILSLLLFGSVHFLVPAMLAILVALLAARKREEDHYVQ